MRAIEMANCIYSENLEMVQRILYGVDVHKCFNAKPYNVSNENMHAFSLALIGVKKKLIQFYFNLFLRLYGSPILSESF